jgi:hypothetical protein
MPTSCWLLFQQGTTCLGGAAQVAACSWGVCVLVNGQNKSISHLKSCPLPQNVGKGTIVHFHRGRDLIGELCQCWDSYHGPHMSPPGSAYGNCCLPRDFANLTAFDDTKFFPILNLKCAALGLAPLVLFYSIRSVTTSCLSLTVSLRCFLLHVTLGCCPFPRV